MNNLKTEITDKDQPGPANAIHLSLDANNEFRVNPLQIQQLGKYWVLNIGDQQHNLNGLGTPTSNSDRFVLDATNFQSNILFNQSEQNGLGIFLSGNVLQNEHGGLVLVDTAKDQQPNEYGLPKTSEQFSQEQLLASQTNENLYSHKIEISQIPQSVAPMVSSSIIKLAPSTGSVNQEESSKPVEAMKVNIDDFSQFFSYHEVFGKLPNELLSTTHSNRTALALESSENSGNPANRLTTGIQTNLPVITSSIIQSNKIPSLAADDAINIVPGPQFRCQLCNEVFQFQYQLIVHKRSHNEKKSIICQVCGQSFKDFEELSVHGKLEHIGDSSMFICTICFNVFASDSSLERHMKKHDQKKYPCNLCQKTFIRMQHLTSHEKSHLGLRPDFSCQYCNKVFTRKDHLINHIKIHENTTEFCCTICSKSFTRREHFVNHSLWHSGLSPHACQICKKKYTRLEHLNNHMRSHTSSPLPFKCQFENCSKNFARKENFRDHILWHSGETNHRCDICMKTFTRKNHLLNHVRQHTNESPNICTFCNKRFTRAEHLLNHIRQHTGETPFKCENCPKSFTRKDHLINHSRQHTGETPFCCTQCPKTYTRREHLINHKKHVHDKTSIHVCTYCLKTFTRKEHLKNHLKLHDGTSEHTCNICNRAFTRKEHLNKHTSLQHSESSHICHICSQEFLRRDLLVQHARSHNNIRPFECEVCKKTFALRGNLLFHQRSHNKGSTAERLFKCDYHDCEKDFICKGHLISHQRSHTQEKRFICSVATCQKKFVEKGNLLRHTKKQHPEIAMQVIRKANSVKSHLLQPQHIQEKQCVIVPNSINPTQPAASSTAAQTIDIEATSRGINEHIMNIQHNQMTIPVTIISNSGEISNIECNVNF